MKVLWKCCLRSLKENKAKTIVTIIGVALATALITALSCMGSSLLRSKIENLKKTEGNYHSLFQGVEQSDLKYFLNNQSLESICLEKRLGYAQMEAGKNAYAGTESFYLDLRAAGEDWLRAQNVELSSGRLPQNDKEIVLARGIRSKMGIDVKIGDVMTLSIGKRMVNGQEVEIGVKVQEGESIVPFQEKNYEVVGFLNMEESQIWGERDGNSKNGRVVRTIQAYTYFDESALTDGIYDLSVRYTKKGLWERERVDSALLGVTEEYYSAVFHDYHVRTEDEKFQLSKRVKQYSGGSTLAFLEAISPFHLTTDSAAMIAIAELFFLMVVLAGVFCINNSFDLTFTERIRFYGILSSVGTTKRQRRVMVWQEAIVIGAFGIPLGILTGVGLTAGLIRGTNFLLRHYVATSKFVMVFDVAWWAVAIAALQAMFMIALSAFESAVRASKIMPIDAIRSSEMIKSKGKPGKSPKLIKRLFGVGGNVAWQNFRRSKIKYRATIVSISISVAMLLSLSFIGLIFEVVKKNMSEAIDLNYQVSVSISDSTGYDQLMEMTTWENVIDARIDREILMIYTNYIEDQKLKDLTKCYFIIPYNEAFFEKLCQENGVDPKDAKGKGIASGKLKSWDEGKIVTGNQATYESIMNEVPGEPVSVEIAGKIKDKSPLNYSWDDAAVIYVGESWVENHRNLFSGSANGHFTCKDANAMIDTVLDMNILNSDCYNTDWEYQQMLFIKTIVIMFLVGFIGVIILIGVTNVINAVGFNLELRSSEFAKLRAIGMTSAQFRKMIWLEGLFIDLKGLLWGTAVGCMISYALYRFCWEANDKNFEFAFRLPWLQILGSFVVVSTLLFVIVERYAKKAMRRNVIETIRNENL